MNLKKIYILITSALVLLLVYSLIFNKSDSHIVQEYKFLSLLKSDLEKVGTRESQCMSILSSDNNSDAHCGIYLEKGLEIQDKKDELLLALVECEKSSSTEDCAKILNDIYSNWREVNLKDVIN